MTTLEGALDQAGTSTDEVLARVDAAVGLRDGDIVLAVGSLVEGLGTSKSDVDLLLISTSDGDEVSECEHAWMVGPRVFDLTVVPWHEVVELCARLAAWAGRPWNVMRLGEFDDAERLRLHRLLHGRQLFPTAAVSAYRPSLADLARLKLHVARHRARTVQVDMVGYRDNGDHASLTYGAQELLGHAVDALLAAHGWTNPYQKWRSRLLERLPDGWERPLGLRPPHRRAARALWDLHRAPAEPVAALTLEHAHRSATFARTVFAWAELGLVVGAPEAFVVPQWGDLPPPGGAVLPNLELDVDFSLAGRTIALARLNHVGQVLEVSDRELSVLLQFDGTTSVAAVEAAMETARNRVGRPDVERLVERATAAGLCVDSKALTSCR